MSTVIKLLFAPLSGGYFYVSERDIVYKSESSEEKIVCYSFDDGKKLSGVATVSSDESLFAVCDTEKNLFLFSINSESKAFSPISVPMNLAKTATGLCFTHFPSKNALLVADKFGDVLRFEQGSDFDRWARESQNNSKALSIHTHKKRSFADAQKEEENNNEKPEEERSQGSEAHHCTIIGHISMITDVAVLPVEGSQGGLIVTCDRDEKVRFTLAATPERIHSFGLAHRQYVGSLAVCASSRSVFSAGGDAFVCEWRLNGETLKDQMILASKITLPQENVQEVQVSECGDRVAVWFLGKEVCVFARESLETEWSLESSREASKVTAMCFARGTLKVCEAYDAENLQKLFAAIGKSKLRKDIERMDWKLKRHANQTTPDDEDD